MHQLPILYPRTSKLESLKLWWNCAKRDKSVYDGICSAILDEMHIAELEPLGVDERVCMALEYEGICTIEDLTNLDFDRLIQVPHIGCTNLWKIFRALTRLSTLDELRGTYLKTIAPNLDDLHKMKRYGLEEVLGIKSLAAGVK